MANTKKRCRACKEYELAESGIKVPLGFFCSMACVISHGKKGATEASVRRVKEAHTKLRAELKTASQWRIDAQKAVNSYVRWRDRDLNCISCDSEGEHNGIGGYWDAGHYRSRGSARHLSFNILNIAKQCHRCNRFLSGNVVEFRHTLIKRIGLEKVEALENNNEVVRHDIKYLRRIKKVFTDKLKLKKRLADHS